MGYAVWERRPVALRPEQIQQVTEIIVVSPNYLFGKAKLPAPKIKSVAKK
jgi:hypothetical protein